jgi:hypothetical protein
VLPSETEALVGDMTPFAPVVAVTV